MTPLSLPPWAVKPEDLPSLPKSKVFHILESALTIAELYYPDELSSRRANILHNLDDGLQQATTNPNKTTTPIKHHKPPQPSSNNNNGITVTVLDVRRSAKTTTTTTDAKGDDEAALSYERKLERSKRKLERGYAAHEQARKRSKVIDFHLGPNKKEEPAKDEFNLLPLGPTATTKKKAVTKAAAAGSHGGEAIAKAAQAKAKPKPPRWWIKLKNEHDAARITSLVHAEIREQQRRHRSQLAI